MNFLLHRHLAASELGSTVAGVGAMLPDLWRLADRRMRAHPSALPKATKASSGGKVVAELRRGVLHHVEADRWFHHTDVFLRGERETADAFKHAGVPKTGLFAHVAWELCLDGAQLARVGAEPELVRLKRHFAAVDPSAMQALALLVAQGEPVVDESFARRMAHLRAGLLGGSWIRGYLSGEGLCERLAGVRSRLGLPSFDTLQQHRLARVLSARLSAASDVLEELLAGRARWLASPNGLGDEGAA